MNLFSSDILSIIWSHWPHLLMLEKSPRTRAFFEHRTVAAYITWLRPIVSTRAAQNWRTLYMYVFRRQRRKKVKLSSKKKKRRDKTFGLTICGTFSMYESQTFLQRISFQFEMHRLKMGPPTRTYLLVTGNFYAKIDLKYLSSKNCIHDPLP